MQKFAVAQQMDLYARSDQAFKREEQAGMVGRLIGARTGEGMCWQSLRIELSLSDTASTEVPHPG